MLFPYSVKRNDIKRKPFVPIWLSQFLAWYLSPFTRMGRGRFNIIFFIALLPPLLIKVVAFQEKAQEVMTTGQGSMQMVQNILGSVSNPTYGGDDADSVRSIQEQRQTMNNLVGASGLLDIGQQPRKHIKEKDTTPWADILSFVILMSLIPLVQMRLRDVGKGGETELWVFTGLIYIAVLFDGLKTILGISMPGFISMIAAGLSFVVLGWLCMKASASYTPPSKRGVSHKPEQVEGFDPYAKNPDDPY